MANQRILRSIFKKVGENNVVNTMETQCTL